MPRFTRTLIVAGVLVLVALVVPEPAEASCVACDAEASCVTLPSGWSGNCECRIRYRNGAQVCIPMGVCPDFCDDGPPPYGFEPDESARITRDLVGFLDKKTPRLGTVVWTLGIQEGKDLVIPLGRSEGTVANELGGARVPAYAFSIEFIEGSRGVLEFRAVVTDSRTLQRESFRGEMWDGGKRGELTIEGSAGLTRSLEWDLTRD